MLRQQLRRLGLTFITTAISAWGLFALIFSGHFDEVPREIWLLGLVLLSAGGAAFIAAIWIRARRPDTTRW